MPISSLPKCSQANQCPSGSFTPAKSSTYTQISRDGVFNITYGDDTGAAGLYFTDVVHVGDSKIDTGLMYIGLATVLQDGTYVNDGTGLVGIGYASNQAQEVYFLEQGVQPLTLIQGMVNNSDIARQAYGLYLNDYYNGNGAIIFGGVDTDKYTGDLVALQIQPTIYDGIANYFDFNVALTGISIEDDNGARRLTDETFQWPALLDSGTTLAGLPTGVLNQITSGLGVADGAVPCSYAHTNASLTFTFGGDGGPTINVPISSLIEAPDGSQFDDGTPACYFDLYEADANGVILGDAFMRNGYFVYDLDNNIVAMAQAKLNSTKEAITKIPPGTVIPGCSSTNSLILSQQTGSVTEPVPGAQTSAVGTSLVAGTPTFALGAAATSGTGSGRGTVCVRGKKLGFAVMAAIGALGLDLVL